MSSVGLDRLVRGAPATEESAVAEPRAVAVAARPRPSLKARAIRGAVWTIGAYGASQGLRLASNLVLTRLLVPEAFGLMALVNVFMQGLAMFSDVGISPSIVQSKRGDDPVFLNTAWTIQATRGLLLWMFSALLAWPMARFYEQPLLIYLLPVSGMSAFIAGFNSTSLVLANRHLALGRVTLLEVFTQFVTLVSVAVLAFFHPSVWALIAGNLIAAAVKVTLSHVALPGVRCRPRWDRSSAKELFSFGRWIFLSTAVTFCAMQGDRLLFGKLIPLGLLGVYTVSASMAVIPTQILLRLGNAIVFPALSSLVQQGRPFAEMFYRCRKPLLALGGMMSSVLLASSPWLIDAIYDQRYTAAGWMLRILSFGLVLQVTLCAAGSAMLAIGKPAGITASNLARLIGLATLVPLGWRMGGMVGALAGLVGADLLKYVCLAVFISRHGISLVSRDLLMLGPIGGSATLGWLLGRMLEANGMGNGFTCTLVIALVLLCWVPIAFWTWRSSMGGRGLLSELAPGKRCAVDLDAMGD